GLPDGFQINVESPSQLGDYLDESLDVDLARVIVSRQRTVATPSEAKPAAPRHGPEHPVSADPRLQVVTSEPQPAPLRSEHVLSLSDTGRRASPRMLVSRRPERMQVNMRPETQKMFGELVEFVQRYSLQDDAKASEILDALISVLHQSRDE